MKTAIEIIRENIHRNPGYKFASLKCGSMIGVWSEQLKRYCAVASATITGHWVSMEFEINVNGKLPYTDSDWIPYDPANGRDCDH